jgi:hypothetical protein
MILQNVQTFCRQTTSRLTPHQFFLRLFLLLAVLLGLSLDPEIAAATALECSNVRCHYLPTPLWSAY